MKELKKWKNLYANSVLESWNISVSISEISFTRCLTPSLSLFLWVSGPVPSSQWLSVTLYSSSDEMITRLQPESLPVPFLWQPGGAVYYSSVTERAETEQYNRRNRLAIKCWDRLHTTKAGKQSSVTSNQCGAHYGCDLWSSRFVTSTLSSLVSDSAQVSLAQASTPSPGLCFRSRARVAYNTIFRGVQLSLATVLLRYECVQTIIFKVTFSQNIVRLESRHCFVFDLLMQRLNSVLLGYCWVLVEFCWSMVK